MSKTRTAEPITTVADRLQVDVEFLTHEIDTGRLEPGFTHPHSGDYWIYLHAIYSHQAVHTSLWVDARAAHHRRSTLPG